MGFKVFRGLGTGFGVKGVLGLLGSFQTVGDFFGCPCHADHVKFVGMSADPIVQTHHGSPSRYSG